MAAPVPPGAVGLDGAAAAAQEPRPDLRNNEAQREAAQEAVQKKSSSSKKKDDGPDLSEYGYQRVQTIGRGQYGI